MHLILEDFSRASMAHTGRSLILPISGPHSSQGASQAPQPREGSRLGRLCAVQAPLTVCALWQKAEMDNVKTKTKKASADRGNEKKTMKDKVLEKEFKLVSSPDLALHRV